MKTQGFASPSNDPTWVEGYLLGKGPTHSVGEMGKGDMFATGEEGFF